MAFVPPRRSHIDGGQSATITLTYMLLPQEKNLHTVCSRTSAAGHFPLILTSAFSMRDSDHKLTYTKREFNLVANIHSVGSVHRLRTEKLKEIRLESGTLNIQVGFNS